MQRKSCALVFLVLLLSCPKCLYAQDSASNFQRLLEQNSLQFSMPPDFWAVRVHSNPDVAYDFAMCSTVMKLEIRYRICPITQAGRVYDAMLVAMALNISGGQMIQPKKYRNPDVKLEFGADAGCSGMVRTNSPFGHDYQYCMISAIHKEGIADVYAFFLFDDPKDVMEAVSSTKVYHALRFR